jgi:transcriptional regulator with XRE-family HTH domain
MANPLRAYRKKHQLSQQQLADKLGVSRSLVAMMEGGNRPFTDDMALLIEDRLGIDRMITRPDLFRRRRAA